MKALFISNDPLIFAKESDVRARMESYALAIGELHVLSTAPRGAVKEQDNGLFLYPVTVPRILRLFIMKRRARALVKTLGIEIVSAQDPFEYGSVALSAVKGTSVPVHLQVHTDFLSPFFAEESMKNRIRIRMADKTLPHAQGIRVVSERVKKSLVARYGDRIKEPTVIPIGMATGLPLPAALPPHTFTYTMVAIGRLEAEKRIDDLLETLAKIRIHYQNTGLFIFGDGSERARLMKKAGELGLSRNVIFLGHRHDARRYLEAAHSFIQTSAYEGYGCTFVEAALARKPIVTTDVGIIGDVFDARNDVLVCSVGDVECLVRQVGRLIEDNPLRKLLADRAEVSVRAHLAAIGSIPERIAADLASVIEKRTLS